jgi:formylglycine-generating enzyme required for sulfatase activity
MLLKPKVKSCCSGLRTSTADAQSHHLYAMSVPAAAPDVREELRSRLVTISGGVYEMGTRKSTHAEDLDSPLRKVRVDDFLISPVAVTNADYARFVKATGYRTVAEREGWSFVFQLFLGDLKRYPQHPPGLPWWRHVAGASWCAPEGPGSSWRERADHPAVHLCWYDALAYATWAGQRLAREAEWEFAARGGLKRKKFPWGNKLVPFSGHAMNVWQGSFPYENTCEDGFIGTAPAKSFSPNGYGLYNMTGNVWEWVSDFYGSRPPPSRIPEGNPTGPTDGYARIQRGGSFLCHVSYCDRYHVHSRAPSEPDNSASNTGFRVAADL